MGEDEKTGERPVCAAWQPVTTFNRQAGKNEEQHDCSVFGWGPDLLTTIAQEVNHGVASTDKVATQVQRSRTDFLGALPEEARERLVTARLELLPESVDKTPR